MILKSFLPFIDRRSRVLILGTMPGPMALKKQEYYGFTVNHFWKIMIELFGGQKDGPGARPYTYAEKKRLLKKNRIALWDVFKSCEREGALDSAIQCAELNYVPGLLKKYPGIKAGFLNGRTAEKTFLGSFASSVRIPFYYLPSTSPAHAGLSFKEKLKIWSVILRPSEVRQSRRRKKRVFSESL